MYTPSICKYLLQDDAWIHLVDVFAVFLREDNCSEAIIASPYTKALILSDTICSSGDCSFIEK